MAAAMIPEPPTEPDPERDDTVRPDDQETPEDYGDDWRVTERMDFSDINPETCSRCYTQPPNPKTLTNLCERCGAIMLLLEIARLNTLTEFEQKALDRLQAEEAAAKR